MERLNYPHPYAGLTARHHAKSPSGRCTQHTLMLRFWAACLGVLLLAIVLLLQGCGSGGYAGAGIASLSATAITLDASQTIAVSANNPGGLNVTWTLAGSTCSGASCGSLSATTGNTITYQAPGATDAPFSVTLQAAIAGTQNSKTVAITVNPAPVITGITPSGTVGTAYTATLSTTGGTTPVKLALLSGTLPPGLTFDSASGKISGTPTTIGTYPVVFQAVDSSNVPFTVTSTRQITIAAVGAALTVIGGNPPAGVVGTTYSTTLQASGGTQPYTWSIASGALPAGLSLSPTTGVISGTPTAQGTSTFTAQAKDATGTTASGSFTINVTSTAQGSLTINVASVPNGTVAVPYSATIGVTGGTAPYTCAITSGTLPAGLALGANCQVNGTPTTAGTSNFGVRATDSSSPAQTTTGNLSITIAPAAVTITTGTLPNGTVGTPYTGTIGASGGTMPYTCALVSGSAPAGLTLNANCSVTGTPITAGTSTPIVRVMDSGNPAQSTQSSVSITINPAAGLTVTSPPPATTGSPYTGTIGVSGGTAPYTCTVTGGTVPAGLTVGANCVVTGTPTGPGTTPITVTVTDSGNPVKTTPAPVTITVNPAVLSITTGALPNGTVGTPYTATIPVNGGTSPYACTITSGTLPAGLSLGAGCAVSGTPTVAGTSNLGVRATDSGNPTQTANGQVTITIADTGSLAITSPPAATVGQSYTGTIPVTGGTAPYTCVQAGGTLPAGLTLGANCQVTGTPTTSGSQTISVKATDSSSPANTKTGLVTITVNPGTTTLTLGNPPTATVETPYTGVIPVTGGTNPYNCTVATGTLPAGLTLGANCTLTGTPTATGTTMVGITATDSANPANTTTGPVTVTVQPVPKLTLTGSVPNAILNQPYTQTLQATGGVAPYTYAITAGNLPAGLNLSTTGVISGTPTVPGASSFTVTATDTEGTPQTASLPLVLLVTYPTTANDGLLTGPYAYLFQGYDDAVAGVLAYQTATVASFTADGTGGVSMGELDSNHQGSNPAGNTVSSNDFLGTYTVGPDLRGTLTITTLNADGTTALTTSYAISLKAPVAPATNSASGSLIEFDNNQLAGTRGTGTLLAQNAAAIANGLAGSYAFGVSGDTPCLPACTVGIASGPVAAVGQFTTNAGAITGTGDANIASTNYANSTLTGGYSAADGNGRVQLSMTQSLLTGGPYPADYAAYIVDATHLFLMSTDKHSAYILQAGTAQLQTQATFSNASLGAPFVGYENSPVNPGLVGTTLQNVANLSTATVFRGTGNADGTCTTTNVDVGGTNGVVSALTGIGSGAPVLNALLGTYQSLGNSNCGVQANGRAVFNYPAPDAFLSATLTTLGLGGQLPAPRIVYLTDNNTGYFLESGYAGLGYLTAQTGGPFTTATLNGTFVYGTIPAGTAANVNSSGAFTADGAGHTTSTLDENVGVGTINVLQLGTTGAANYTLTDAAAGRYLLGTSRVIYALSPGRFVLLETDALSTAPYIALLF